MKITFLEEAKLEFLDAISYYESEPPGLGQRFKDELDRSLLWLAERAEVCRLRSGGYRRINLRSSICPEGNDSVGPGDCSPPA